MTHDLHETTQSLITDIEKKDRRFRVAQSVFMAAALVGLAMAIIIGYQTVTTLENRLSQNDADNAAKLQDLQNHIDCLFTLAETPNHSTTQIADLKGCKLKPTSATIAPTVAPNTIPFAQTAQPSQPLAVAQPQQTPAVVASPNNTPPPDTQKNVPQPAPHPLVCTLTLGLLGCK